MAQHSNETIEKIMLDVRRLMVREPKISARRVAHLLGYDKNYIAKLKRKIDRENKMDIQRALVEDDIAELQNMYRAMAIDMYQIIVGSGKEMDKINAFKNLFDAKIKLIGQKMDAGIFKRSIGELTIEANLSSENQKILDKAINYAIGRAKQSRDRSDKAEQTSEEEGGN